MPNWCTNGLTVEGDPDKVQKFREDNTYVEVGEDAGMASGDHRVLPLSFEAKYPTPRQADGKLIGEGPKVTPGMPDWYQWRIDNWGTKWDLTEETDVEHDGDYIHYSFDSAWGPPAIWVEKVAAEYPDLKFTIDFEEPGMNFWGVLIFEDGEMVSEEEGSMDYNEDTGETTRI